MDILISNRGGGGFLGVEFLNHIVKKLISLVYKSIKNIFRKLPIVYSAFYQKRQY
jgi:hypothetical protein